MSKHANISVFIPHLGCPYNCIFCDQYKITGSDRAVTPSDVIDVLTKASLNERIDKRNTQIAFFGGSFTAIGNDLMVRYLEAADRFVGDGGFDSIRISTRPDCIDKEIIDTLKAYNVKTVELGIQSFDDAVLNASKRGYDSKTAENACKMITDSGLELGIQMMCGLPEDNADKDADTARKIISLGCRQVRIYPVVVIRGTELHGMYERGEYYPLSVDAAVNVCSKLYSMFTKNNVTVLKMGLHSASDGVAGPFHPAFGELVRSEAFYNDVSKELSPDENCTVYVNPRFLSTAVGNGKRNLRRFGPRVIVKTDPDVEYGKYIIQKTSD